MPTIDFSKPQREAVLAIIFSTGFLIRKLITVFWPLLVLYVFKGNSSLIFHSIWTYIALSSSFIIVAILGFLSWRNFFFYIKDNEFVVEKGYLKKSITSIPLEKIVSINTNQKLLHQILKVVELKIDSTGTENKEVRIRALTKDYASLLEQELSNSSKIKKNESPSTTEKTQDNQPIISLSFLNLIKIGVSRNHLQTIILITVFVNQLQNQLKDFYKEEIATTISETQSVLEHSSILIWAGIIIFLLILSLAISIARTFLSYFNLELLQIKESFILRSGLLKRKTVTVPFSRIQAIQHYANPLQKWLQIATLRLVQASGKVQTKDADKVLIPGCSTTQTNKIRTAVIQIKEEETLLLYPHWALRNRLFFIRSLVLIPFIIGVYFYPYLWWTVLVVFLWILISVLLTYKYRKYRISKHLLQINSGGILKIQTLFEYHKVQAIHIKQSYFQRRRNTATLKLGLAGIQVNLDYIPYEKAVEIKDFLLYEIAKEEKSWM